ncbi:hypothetical protein OVY01_11745 [Robbsia sp. Bb-Pol-6]|uniref:Uncharacterized protein n=1 Tax=Robbsia betulipollinis TaxID=2981849 RepID=A0ABT3ZN43_9BURK|nr:hypothetical protein [Robbsia betulipollinis]MCY0387897.1 hypothetical protein [Robbsia betulipollinis]
MTNIKWGDRKRELEAIKRSVKVVRLGERLASTPLLSTYLISATVAIRFRGTTYEVTVEEREPFVQRMRDVDLDDFDPEEPVNSRMFAFEGGDWRELKSAIQQQLFGGLLGDVPDEDEPLGVLEDLGYLTCDLPEAIQHVVRRHIDVFNTSRRLILLNNNVAQQDGGPRWLM